MTNEHQHRPADTSEATSLGRYRDVYVTQKCQCGAVRRVQTNGVRLETGPWCERRDVLMVIR